MMEHWLVGTLHQFRTRMEVEGYSADMIVAKHPDIEKQQKRVGCLSVDVYYREWIPVYTKLIAL